MNEMNQKVSVIIPTYNRECKYLLRAINSIENQTYNNIELIVVDDNHPESIYRHEIRMFMKQYEKKTNIVYLENIRNMGGAIARNNGISNATGDFVTFLDDDDEYLPRKIEKQLNFMIRNNCDMSFTDLKIVNDNNVVIDYREYNNLQKFDKESLLKYHIMRHLTGTPTFMYRTEKLRQIGGFEDVNMGQEFYLMLKSIENKLNICYLDSCDVIAYRHNDGGISQGENKINGEIDLYKFKKKYLHIFTKRERIFIKFRHYAVMTVAYIRNKNYCKAFISGIIMILVSPIDFIKEIRRFIINIIKKDDRSNNL